MVDASDGLVPAGAQRLTGRMRLSHGLPDVVAGLHGSHSGKAARASAVMVSQVIVMVKD